MTGRSRKPRPPRTAPRPLTPLEAYDQAPTLVLELAGHAGDPRAVAVVLRSWLEEHGSRDATLIATAALALTFGESLTRVPTEQLPPGELAMTAPSSTEDRRSA